VSSVEEMQKKFGTEKKAFFRGLLFISVPVIIAIILVVFAGIAGGIIGAIIVLVSFFLVLYFIWAPSDVFGTFPEEGYATIIVRGLGFRKAFLKIKGKGLDNNWEVIDSSVSTKKQKEYMGMVVFFWPFDRLYVYKQRWIKYTEKEKSVDKEEVLRGALLKSYVYFIGLTGAEDLNNMPIDIGMAVEMKMVNPYKALFVIQNWYRGIANFIQGEIRNEIRKYGYSDLISLKKSQNQGDSLDKIFQSHISSFYNDIKERFGIEIVNLKVVQLSPSDKEFIVASTRKTIAEFNKEATIVNADAQRYKRTAETIGPVIDMLKERTGLTEAQIQEQMRDFPKEFQEKYGDVIKNALELVKIQIAGDKYVKIETSAGGSEGSNPLLELIALSQVLMSGKQGGSKTNPQESSPSDEGKTKTKTKTRDEKLKEFLDTIGLEK
jgi:regulator of protease activity HflC (stomatin/prohibitin superfamily)